jgi:hypothetical protein
MPFFTTVFKLRLKTVDIILHAIHAESVSASIGRLFLLTTWDAAFVTHPETFSQVYNEEHPDSPIACKYMDSDYSDNALAACSIYNMASPRGLIAADREVRHTIAHLLQLPSSALREIVFHGNNYSSPQMVFAVDTIRGIHEINAIY